MCYQRDIDNEETEEMSKFKELYPDSLLDEDETVFKKPKPKVSRENNVNMWYYNDLCITNA